MAQKSAWKSMTMKNCRKSVGSVGAPSAPRHKKNHILTYGISQLFVRKSGNENHTTKKAVEASPQGYLIFIVVVLLENLARLDRFYLLVKTDRRNQIRKCCNGHIVHCVVLCGKHIDAVFVAREIDVLLIETLSLVVERCHSINLNNIWCCF